MIRSISSRGIGRAGIPPQVSPSPTRDPGSNAETAGLRVAMTLPNVVEDTSPARVPVGSLLGPVFRDCTTFIDRVTAKVRHTESEAA